MTPPERPPRIRCRDGGANTLRLIEGGREAADGRTLSGTFSVFDRWQEINSPAEGRFLERIQAGSFSKTIAERGDKVALLYSHGRDPVLGSLVLGKLRSLQETAEGATYEAELFDGVPELLLNGLREGRYGSSFRAKVVKEEFNPRPGRSEWNPLGLPESTIKEVRLMDVGPTSLPAYPVAPAQMRSLKVPEPTLEAGAKPYWQLGEEAQPSWYLGEREERRSIRTITPRPAWQLGKEDEDYWYLGKREEGRHARAVTR